MNFKDIHIGQLLRSRLEKENLDSDRVCNFLKCSEAEIEVMFTQKEISTDILLKWSKLLKYDFFRLYSHHLILYAPQKKSGDKKVKVSKQSALPQFRKSLYTEEIIMFVLELIFTGQKSKNQVIEEYNIPKTTLYKWIHKYR